MGKIPESPCGEVERDMARARSRFICKVPSPTPTRISLAGKARKELCRTHASEAFVFSPPRDRL